MKLKECPICGSPLEYATLEWRYATIFEIELGSEGESTVIDADDEDCGDNMDFEFYCKGEARHGEGDIFDFLEKNNLFAADQQETEAT